MYILLYSFTINALVTLTLVLPLLFPAAWRLQKIYVHKTRKMKTMTHSWRYLPKNAKLTYSAKETGYVWSNAPEICVMLKHALINDKSNEYIFRAITKTKTREKLRNLNKLLSYTRTRERLLEALVDIVLRNKDFVLIVFVEAGRH